MQYQTILFDLDGTLTNPKVGITKSIEYALNHFGIEVSDRDDLCQFIGPPLKDTFMEQYGFDYEQAQIAIAKYRERFSRVGILENVLYAGIPQLLSDLKFQGKKVLLATSKPTVFAQRILDFFAIAPYFNFVAGAELDGSRDKKEDVIAYALTKVPASHRAHVLMVGDRRQDVFGARKNGLDSLGVLYGFGDEAELTSAGATHLAKTVQAVRDFILSASN